MTSVDLSADGPDSAPSLGASVVVPPEVRRVLTSAFEDGDVDCRCLNDTPARLDRAGSGPVREYRLNRFPRKLSAPGVGQSPSAVSDGAAPGADCLHVRRYFAPNWWSSRGVAAKRKQIEAKGMPSMRDWRMITLTVDPALFEDEEIPFLAAYLKGRSRMRNFLAALRREDLFGKGLRWAWKLEFQRNGAPHWHLFLEWKRKYSVAQMNRIAALWGLGRINVQMIRKNDFGYSFKYAFKPVREDHRQSELFGDESVAFSLPDWFMDYFKFEETGTDQPPKSFARVRFWQTSIGFYTKKNDSPPALAPKTCILPWSVRELAERSLFVVQVVARSYLGHYKASHLVQLSQDSRAFWLRVTRSILHAESAGLGIFNAVIPASTINTRQTWLINKLRKENRFTMKAALAHSLTRDRNWATC